MRFPINRRCGRNYAGVGVDLEQPTRVAGQAVGDRVVRRIKVKGIGRQANGRANRYVFVYSVDRRIVVRRNRNDKLVDVVDRDVEVLRGRRAIAGCRLNRD